MPLSSNISIPYISKKARARSFENCPHPCYNKPMPRQYDVIIIGAGHAGCEAAMAASKIGAKTLLVTMSLETIGLLSCNPAIGGLAKGQLVKEVDALGGWIGKATDASLIQFRLLNTRKGPAVRSSRAQVDRQAYRRYMRSVIENQANLDTKEAMVESITIKNGAVEGIVTSLGEKINGRAIAVTPGTFLNGLMHIGLESRKGGRVGEGPSEGLSKSLKDMGLRMGRLKTGTCARIDGKSINFDKLQKQNGTEPIIPFSFDNKNISRDQLPCHITYTNKRTHDIIRANLDRSPLFTGVIKGTGVRYCPSIEDKIYRFPERDRHHIFLEPEGAHTTEYYPNGISTSLPLDVQKEMVLSIAGLEKAVITKPGYGIEYDFVDPTELYPTLETKKIPGLYLAGQINGTTGYEEAASLGLVAGVNAAVRVKGGEPFILDRSEGYIGVLIDDLVTKGTSEPYRMFTSRVEYRLLLREDNADLRLTPVGRDIGLIDKLRYDRTMKRAERIKNEIERLKNKRLEKRLRRPGVSYKELVRECDEKLPEDDARVVETQVKYEGFIQRQVREIARMQKIERIKIPGAIDYGGIPGLSSEIKEKLGRLRPLNLGQASRVSGVTPAAISILMIWVEKMRRPG